MLDTILFDLDGTLVPFNEKEFVECYFAGVVKKLHHLGVDGQLIIKGIWIRLLQEALRINCL